MTAPAPAPEPATPEGWHSARRARLVLLTLFVVASVFVVRDLANRHPPTVGGDIWEHWLIAESFDRHGTPELRPEDKATVYAQAAQFGYFPPDPNHPYAYMPAPDGRWYGVHFWGYAAAGVPAKAALRWSGRSDLAWPAVSNAVWFLLAIGITLFASTAPVRERVALVGLAAAGPGWTYVAWPGSELFSWAFVLIAVVTFRDRRYGWAGVAAGIAALQNPPAIVFGGFAFLAAVLERKWRAAAGCVVGTSIGLLPFAFFKYHFNKPSLIAEEFARSEYISWMRGWSQLTDLSQGLLPYAPLLAVALVVAVPMIAYRREVRGLFLIGALVAVAVGVQVSRNWNSGCDGMQRYLVWMLPLAAAVVVDGIGGRRRLWALALAAVVAHSVLTYEYKRHDVLPGGYLGHSKMAVWVLDRYPELYWAEYEVFVERTRRGDNWPMTPAPLPVATQRPDGTVSKMLMDKESVDRVAEVFVAEPAYISALRAQAAKHPGLFYAHPPRGAVRVRSTEQTAKPE